jgi:hypothetical protein
MTMDKKHEEYLMHHNASSYREEETDIPTRYGGSSRNLESCWRRPGESAERRKLTFDQAMERFPQFPGWSVHLRMVV